MNRLLQYLARLSLLKLTSLPGRFLRLSRLHIIFSSLFGLGLRCLAAFLSIVIIIPSDRYLNWLKIQLRCRHNTIAKHFLQLDIRWCLWTGAWPLAYVLRDLVLIRFFVNTQLFVILCFCVDKINGNLLHRLVSTLNHLLSRCLAMVIIRNGHGSLLDAWLELRRYELGALLRNQLMLRCCRLHSARSTKLAKITTNVLIKNKIYQEKID